MSYKSLYDSATAHGNKTGCFNVKGARKKNRDLQTHLLWHPGGGYFYGRIIFTPQIIFTKQIPIFKFSKIWKFENRWKFSPKKAPLILIPLYLLLVPNPQKFPPAANFSSKFRNDILQPGFRNRRKSLNRDFGGILEFPFCQTKRIELFEIL